MTFGEIKTMNLSDDTEIKINSVWDEDKQDFTAVSCDGFFSQKDNKVYLTPNVISI